MDEERQIGAHLGSLKDLAPSGYAIALHIKFTTPTLLFQTYPKAWIDVYSQRGFVMRDPTVLWAFDNLGVIDWTDLASNDSDGVMALAREYGMNHGITYSLASNDSRSIASFTRSDRPLTDAEIVRIRDIVDQMHNLTDGLDALSAETRDALKKMSILFTHPGPSA